MFLACVSLMVVCLCVISVVSLSRPLSLCVVSWLLCSSFLGMRVPGLFLLCVSLRVPCVSYVSWWSVGCLWLVAFLCGVVTLGVLCLLSLLAWLCWYLGLLVVYVFLMCSAYCSSRCAPRVSVLLVGVPACFVLLIFVFLLCCCV